MDTEEKKRKDSTFSTPASLLVRYPTTLLVFSLAFCSLLGRQLIEIFPLIKWNENNSLSKIIQEKKNKPGKKNPNITTQQNPQ